jgi:hypothetical protein
MFFLFGIAGAYVLIRNSNNPVDFTPSTSIPKEYRRNFENGILLEGWKQQGRYLTNSGHPDEYRNLIRYGSRDNTKTLPSLRAEASRNGSLNAQLLDSHNYNHQVVSKQRFANAADDITFHVNDFLSPWYYKTRNAYGTPRVTVVSTQI